MSKHVCTVLAAALAVLSLAVATQAPAESLEDLPRFKDFHVQRFSSTDRNGGNFDMVPLAPGETKVLAEMDGPGCITHIWTTHLYPVRGSLRKLVIRAWFDNAETPCVEAPLGDFFGLGHAAIYSYASEALQVGTYGGLNSFWKMPFAKHAKLTITNEGRHRCPAFYYYVDYRKYDKPQGDMACFHAVYHQAMPCKKGEPYTLLEATGRGHYVGCNLSIEQNEEGWWGEGDDRFYIDGESTPSLTGTGSEDYFSGAWCYMNEFAFPYLGMPFRARVTGDGTLDRYAPELKREQAPQWQWPSAWKKGDLWNVYRYHVADPIPFEKSLRMEIEHGADHNERQDSYSSVAYWYQSEPHAPQQPMAPVAERIPHYLRLQERAGGIYEAEDFVDVASSSQGEVTEADMNFWGKGAWSRNAILTWSAEAVGSTMTLPLSVAKTANYDLVLSAACTRRGASYRITLDGKPLRNRVELSQGSIFPFARQITLGPVRLEQGKHELGFELLARKEGGEAPELGLDAIRLLPRGK